MNKFKNREQFFNQAREIFGCRSSITVSFENEGCIKNQDDVEDLCNQAENFIKTREFELESLRRRIKSFTSQLINDCIQGEVY